MNAQQPVDPMTYPNMMLSALLDGKRTTDTPEPNPICEECGESLLSDHYHIVRVLVPAIKESEVQ